MKKQDLTERFATKCAEAAIGYSHASFFAGLHAMNSAFETWSRTCEAFTTLPNAKAKSWFRHPDDKGANGPFMSPVQSWFSMAAPPAVMMTQATTMPWWFSAPAVSQAWADFLRTPQMTFSWPLGDASPADFSVWPMTWSMVTAGVPHEVARPTAEANAAAYDAIDSAKQIADETVASYAKYAKPYQVETRPLAPKSSADPDDPLALFRPWFTNPSAA